MNTPVMPPPLVQTTPPPLPSAGQAPMTPPASRASGPAIASLVLGIMGLVLFPIGLLLGIPGFILGLTGLKKTTTRKGVAIAGMVCSGIAVLLSLVVVLIAISIPSAVHIDMDAARSAQVANNGKQIVTAIHSANIDRVANMRGEVWPVSDRWDDSNEYFAYLMGDGRKAIISGIPFSAFAGRGVDPAADMDEFRQGGNVWTILAGIGTCNDSRMPFMWTSNLRLTQADLEDYVRDPYTERSLAHRLDPSAEPFGGYCVVMITKGAAMFTIKASDLTTKTFFGGALPEDVDRLEIVEPCRSALISSHESIERIGETVTTISWIETAAQTWEIRHFKKPDSLDLLLQPDGDREPLLPARAKTDAWGNDIQYRLNGRKVEIRSAGPDGQMFTRDDITN